MKVFFVARQYRTFVVKCFTLEIILLYDSIGNLMQKSAKFRTIIRIESCKISFQWPNHKTIRRIDLIWYVTQKTETFEKSKL